MPLSINVGIITSYRHAPQTRRAGPTLATEAKHTMQVGRMLARCGRHEVVAIDGVGYLPLAEVSAEFLFQIVADRAEKAALIVTTSLPFSDWTQVTLACARRCSIGSPPERTFSKPEASRIGFAGRWRMTS